MVELVFNAHTYFSLCYTTFSGARLVWKGMGDAHNKCRRYEGAEAGLCTYGLKLDAGRFAAHCRPHAKREIRQALCESIHEFVSLRG
jgi:hypothetical protein